MANDNFVEIASSQTYAKVQELVANLKEVSSQVKNINSNLNKSKLPSDNKNSLNEINEQQKKLNATREKSNKLSTEELLNNRLQRQQETLLLKTKNELAGAYGRLSAQQAVSAKRVQDLVARGAALGQSQRSYNRELKTAQAEFNKLNTRVLLADKAVGRFNRNVGNYPKKAILGIRELLGAFGVVGGVALIASMTKAVYEQVKAQQSLDLALKQVTGTQEELLRAQAFIREQAEKNGAEINSLTTAYTKFYVSAKDKIATKEIEDIFGSITKAGATMGLTVENQERAFTALNQMFSKGTVQAEELKTQLGDALPGAIGIMTRAYQKLHPELKINEASFAKLMKDGKILASEVLPEFARELERTYGIDTLDRVENLATAQNRLTNSFKNFINALNTGQGVIGSFFTRVSQGIANNLDSLSELVKSDAQNARDKNDQLRLNAYNKELEYLMEIGKEKRKQQAEEDRAYAEGQLKQMQDDKASLNTQLGWNPETKEFANEVTDEDVRMLRFYNGEISALRGKISATKKALEELQVTKTEDTGLTKEQIADAKRLAEMLERLRGEYAKNDFALRMMRNESEKNSLEDLIEEEQRYIEERLMLSQELYDAEAVMAKEQLFEEIRLSKESYNKGVKDAKGNKAILSQLTQNYLLDTQTAYERFNEKIYNSDKEYEKRTLKLKEDYLDKYYEYRAKFQGEGLKFEVDPIADEWFDKQSEKAQKLLDRTKELKNATKEYLDSFSLGFLEDAGLGSLTKFFDQSIDPLTGKMQSTFDKLWEGAETTKEKFAVAFTAVTEVVQEAMNFINQAQQAYFDAQYARLEKEHDLAIMYAGDSESAKEEIERQYEERRREIRRKEAEAQKELAIFNAIINTAQGVVAALANPGGPAGIALAAAVGVIGAAQIALIASQPVPEYRLGTDFHKGGKAIVGDGGKHEVVYQPSSGFSITPKTDTLIDLERGSKVYPDINSFLKNSGAMLGGIPNISLENSGITKNEMEHIMSKFGQVNSGSNITVSKTGVSDFIGESIARQKNMNDRFSFKPRKV